jgi:hypothetical protein
MRELVFILLFALMANYGWGQTDIPNTPAGRALQAWLDAANSGRTAKIEAFVRYIDPTQTQPQGFRPATSPCALPGDLVMWMSLQ